MSYYKVIGLDKEPFSTSPDPHFFYQSSGHRAILTRIRTSIKLKRGLSVILGNVGTGKTTMARKLAQILDVERNVIFRMILNPIYRTEKQFLIDLAELFHVEIDTKRPSVIEYMKAIERYLFKKGVEEGKTVVLLVDEAQKIHKVCLEVLRALLNYETNEYKILQLILMGQMELLGYIKQFKNFWDRISLKSVLVPFNLEDTKEMIEFRLRQAGYNFYKPLFTEEAVRMIYEYTRGYPRRISMLCHDALEYIVMYEMGVVTEKVIQELIDKETKLLSKEPVVV